MVAPGARPASATPRAVAASEDLASLRCSNAGTPHPASVTVTTLDVLTHVAEHPGASAGVGLLALRRVWSALCAILNEALFPRAGQPRGVQLPGFGVFTIRKAKQDKGTWGQHVRLLPAFCLLPSFCRRYTIDPHKRMTMQATHQGSSPVAPLSSIAVGLRAGVAKDAVTNALNDIWRAVGELSLRGGTFVMDFAVARVVFHAHRNEVFWSNPSFEMTDASASQARRNLADTRQTVTVASPLSHGGAPLDGLGSGCPADGRCDTPLRIGPEGKIVDRAADVDTVSSFRSRLSAALGSAARMESGYAPGTRGAATPASLARPTSAPPYRAAAADGVSLSDDFAGSVGSGAVPSPAAEAGLTAAERYAVRKRQRVLFRRQRNRGHVAAWDAQCQSNRLKELALQSDDRSRGDALRELAVADKERQLKVKVDRRSAARRVADINQQLAMVRRPGKAGSEQRTRDGGTDDLSVLRQRLGELQRKVDQAVPEVPVSEPPAEQEIDAMAAFDEVTKGMRSAANPLAQLAEIEREEQERMKMAMRYGSDRHRETPKRQEREPLPRPTTSLSGPVRPPLSATHPASLPLDDLAEQESRRQVARAVMQANLSATEAARDQHRRETQRKRTRGRRHHERWLRNAERQRMDSDQRRREEQSLLRQAWDAQVTEREERRAAEKAEHMKKWKAPRHWRNESSGEDDD